MSDPVRHVDFEGRLPPTVDEAAVRRMAVVSHVLDDLVRIPGTNVRVGLDPLVGALPVAGDVIGGAVSLYVVAESARLGVSYTTLVRMLANVGLDVAIGSIPYVGDILDAGWKANERNLALALSDLATDGADGGTAGTDDAVEIEIE